MAGDTKDTTWEIIQGDCLEVMAGMEAGSVDMCVTDPPYFLPAQHYGTRTQFQRSLCDLGMLEHFYRAVFQALARVIKPSGAAYMFCDGQSYPVFFVGMYSYVKAARPLVWDKQTSINGYGWRHQHELILYAEYPDCKPVPTGDGDIIRCRAVPVKERAHPAQKPVDLLRALISKHSKEGDIVLDPFCGSGTTGEAALSLSRRFIGCDSDPRYCDMARKRIGGAMPLFAEENK